MSTTSPINRLPIPDDNSPGDPPQTFQAYTDVLDSLLNSVFDSTSARDAAIPAPKFGQECWVSGVGKQINANGTTGGWVTKFDTAPWPCYGRMSGSGTQAIPSDGAFHVLDFDVVDFTSNMSFSSGNGKLIVNFDGTYEVCGSVNFEGQSAAGRRIAAIYRNNALIAPTQNSCYPSAANTAPLATAVYPIKLRANDYIQVAGRQDSGNDGLLVDRTSSFVAVKYMGPF